jgi:predicted lysophospholipase L1 biosynthesis ABC-type transport system permease subunit
MMGFPFARQDRTVVGVVGDIRFRGLEEESEPQVYLAHRQMPDNTSVGYIPKELVVRSSAADATIIPAIRNIIRVADREMPIAAARSLSDLIDRQTSQRSTQIRLVASFAVLSLALAGIGLYGLLSFAVGQRMPEFGLRIALGAESRDILSLILRQGLVLACLGTGAGLLLSYAAGRSIQALLAGVDPSDPATLAVAAVVAFAMTLAGSLLPALRAMRTDPATAIRTE